MIPKDKDKSCSLRKNEVVKIEGNTNCEDGGMLHLTCCVIQNTLKVNGTKLKENQTDLGIITYNKSEHNYSSLGFCIDCNELVNNTNFSCATTTSQESSNNLALTVFPITNIIKTSEVHIRPRQQLDYGKYKRVTYCIPCI